jgi:hypothetical protein
MMAFVVMNEALMDENVWSEYVKGVLKAELKRKNVTYKQLAERLSAFGVSETESNIKNKISRGGFTAVFFVQCLAAIGTQVVRFDDLPATG